MDFSKEKEFQTVRLNRKRVLLIRMSSIGDVAQCLPTAAALRGEGWEVHWLIKENFADVVRTSTDIAKVWTWKPGDSLQSLISRLSRENFTHVYDAQNNLRTTLIRWGLFLRRPSLKILRKPHQRLRKFLWIRWGWSSWDTYYSAREFLRPLQAWSVPTVFPVRPNLPLASQGPIALVPVANYDLKKWPLEHWKKLISLFPNERFLVLGGAKDRAELEQLQGPQVKVHTEQSLEESLQLLRQCRAVVGNDTGLSHWSDWVGIPLVLILGPTAFGRPFRPSSRAAEVELSCRPCSRFGKNSCRIVETKKCLLEVTPERVRDLLIAQLERKLS